MKQSNLTQIVAYRIAYGLFIILALYQFFVLNDSIDAASSMAIALIFDPFDPQQPRDKRPLWQKCWLVIHLIVAAGLLGFGIGLHDR